MYLRVSIYFSSLQNENYTNTAKKTRSTETNLIRINHVRITCSNLNLLGNATHFFTISTCEKVEKVTAL